MKTFRSLALILCILTPGAGRAGDAKEAAAVVDRAIAACGGAEKLGALRAGVWKTSGTFRGAQSRSEFSGELPDKFRIESTRVVDGKPVRHARIIDGDRGWVVEGDKVTPMTEGELKGVRASYYHKQLALTLTPLKHRDCRLTLGGVAEVNGRPASVIKAARDGYPEVTLYFDRTTGLLAKTEMTAPPRNPEEKGVQVELYFSDFREFGGIKLPARTRAVHDGKPFLETEITEFKALPKLPEGTFRP